MDNHSDLWVAIGTVAPLVGIGHVVLIGRGLLKVRDESALLDQFLMTDGKELAERYRRVEGELFELNIRLARLASRRHHPRDLTRDARKKAIAELKLRRSAANADLSEMSPEFEAWRREARRHQLPAARAEWWGLVTDVCVAVGWLLTAIALGVAFLSLSWNRDVFDPVAASVMVWAAFMLLLAPLASEVTISYARREAKRRGTSQKAEGSDRQDRCSGDSPPHPAR